MAHRNIPVKELNDLNAELASLRKENAELRQLRDKYEAMTKERNQAAARVGELTTERDQLLAGQTPAVQKFYFREDGALMTAEAHQASLAAKAAAEAEATKNASMNAVEGKTRDEQLLEANPRVSKTIVDRPQASSVDKTVVHNMSKTNKTDGSEKKAYDEKWDAEAENAKGLLNKSSKKD